MKKIFKIAKLELSNLFYSPIAWFLLIVFVFQAAFNFTHTLDGLMRSKHLMDKDDIFGFLTNYIFSGWATSLFPGLLDKLYLYLPLLTMGLISREMNSGTISLLYSSPVKVREIVFGKFLAMVGYALVLIGVLMLFGITAFWFIPHMDVALFLSGLFGVFLLLCTYAAIGLFMSCLTSYQVVAALSTFVVFAALTYVGQIWQKVDFVRDLTYFLSISGRTSKMIAGLITTKDVFYFVLIAGMFLVFSIIKLQSGRETKAWYIKAGKYVGIFAFVLLAGYITSRPGYVGYWDVTATNVNTITESAQKIIKELDSPLEVTTYINYLDRNYYLGSPDKRNADLDRWEKYIRFKKDITLKYVYYYDDVPSDPYLHKYMNKNKTILQIAQKRAEADKDDLDRFKTPAEIHKEINLLPEGNKYVMRLKYKGRTTFLRIFDDPETWPSETEVSAALKRLISIPPKIGFLQGDYERSIDKDGDDAYKNIVNLKPFRYSLINQGFDVTPVMADSTHSIPADIAALVIADPRKELSPAALNAIRKYVAAGGNLMILGKPGKQEILNPLLKMLGVQLMPGQILQDSSAYAQNIATVYLTKEAAQWSPVLQGAYNDSTFVSMPGVCGINYKDSEGFRITPLLLTDSAKSWNHVGNVVLDSSAIKYNPALGDGKGPFATTIALTRTVNGKEQRIIVSGDADVMSNAELGRKNMGRTVNFQFNTVLFGWFTYGKFPVNSYRPKAKDHFFTLSDAGFKIINIGLLWILPVALLLFGTILLIRRRRK
ncbi:hypothetical protein A9P82_10100 [Arachidicoccus ginsenosidimutans]|uniref:DUF4350 domain-containing protein n=1 Tax=Arachidicoccus sp. BS20 TaxID=1850526 RepID=UPI0007F173B5|nr:DUF4350 domain-containing protein [Arachidicoccus sp. BS20]ANI89609.1 hypothetical protein A9P82_10100 [Arachidicoccus sp. BS20]